MNVYAIVNGINSLCSLFIAVIIFLSRSRKPTQITYAFFCVLVFFWASSYFMWGIQSVEASAIFWFRVLVCVVCFIHTAYFHFTLSFTNTVSNYKKLLIVGYVLSFCFLLATLGGRMFDSANIRDKSPFHFWPHASPLIGIFIVVEAFYVFFAFYVQMKFIRKAVKLMKDPLIYFFILGILCWIGGMMNWFHWYDGIPIPPVGNIAITLYLTTTAYLVFKHDILELNLALKKTFIYTFLTLFISLIYTMFIVMSERLFQSYTGYNSMIASILAALTIAILFNPMRGFLNRFVERIFLGRNIEQLSNEYLQMKSELQKQDRLKAVATFAAGMAHEVKNPLTSIRTFAEYLPQKYDDPDFRQKFKRIVVEEVDRVNSIVTQLLEFSKPKELELKECLITGILDETLGFLNSHLLKNKIEVQKDYEESPCLFVDKNQLKQAFLNIFLNSIQAMPEGGLLKVGISSAGSDSYQISITDTGPGIPKEQLGHVFDPFFTTKETGTGLGLSIVHGIITKHGGNIEARSEEGRGTTISVVLKNQSSCTRAS